ncbi:MAG: branched-chain amino acid ABC transporter permease, partial [Actinomycetota bacterium]|nr:branched-chain amino acid ABC transporter permease [Actinomycetota bacterium]MED5233215.1 branched-chain amino acid ABC transporter permease [Actinomycetota bacterium]MEE3353806.1 branched-chain amino acid ABC transporter permease [Actinomycetota bacterium]
KGTDPRSVFYLVLAFCAIAIYTSWRLQASRLGRAWMAIREDEQVAEAMGINTVNAKLMAFVVGAVLASFSGAVLAAKVGSIFPTSFMILVSIIILVVVIVGGMGNIAGVLVGSFVLIGVLGGPKQPGLLQEFQNYKLLIYGVLLVFMMLKRPEGLVPSARRSRELHQQEFLQDAWLKGDKLDADDDETGAPAAVSAGDEGGEEE